MSPADRLEGSERPVFASHRMGEGFVVLAPESVDAVARRVVELLADAPTETSGPLVWTPAQVAEHVGRSVDWVREHRHDLGVLPAEGERPRLLFDPAAVRAWASARDRSVRSVPTEPASALTSAPRRPRRNRTGADLIPIRETGRAA